MMNRESLSAVAWHEAGHIVVACILGVPLGSGAYVASETEGGAWIDTKGASLDIAVQIKVAGTIAQHICSAPPDLGSDVVPAIRALLSANSCDYFEATQCLVTDNGWTDREAKLLNRAIQATYDILTAPGVRSALESVAEALIAVTPNGVSGSRLSELVQLAIETHSEVAH